MSQFHNFFIGIIRRIFRIILQRRHIINTGTVDLLIHLFAVLFCVLAPVFLRLSILFHLRRFFFFFRFMLLKFIISLRDLLSHIIGSVERTLHTAPVKAIPGHLFPMTIWIDPAAYHFIFKAFQRGNITIRHSNRFL